ncbi:katanin p80 WD40 repeat-containing subunit B1-like isoform X2 [Anneissia japonica]|uniref:katanin p80 WD40 repeat-containing subunit B1-like isoform X2 n=1 Tax=Anneissia japonica TaxID=1529436 RepID=UPI001425A387|nr:katanin p80 WD40 repeat-containing subunit B1-like isoform X2 [Anneissia japonica]XP_033101056.1 katanin p80 WD40 repeat-containing subunit B1-like isoform X2 [Anneissia japonica]
MADPSANQQGFIRWDMKKKKYIWAGPQEEQMKQPPKNQNIEHKEHCERPPWNNDIQCSEPTSEKQTVPEDEAINQEPDEVRQITSGHKNMAMILGNRLIQVKAAHTFWQKSPDSLVSYLLRTNDDATTVDVLPHLSFNVKNKTNKGKELTMGACLDLLPVLQRILGSKYEDYIVASLDMILGILRNWWKDLAALGESPLKSRGLQCSRSTSGIYTSIISMTDDINKLRKREGRIGSKAKVIGDLLQKL